MDLADDILLSILVATDAIFIPDRDPRDHVRHVVLYERRRDFPLRGVPWGSEMVAPGLGDAGRKEVQRTLETLAAQGLVESFRPHGVKTLGVKLTDRSEAKLRARCGLPGMPESFAELDRLYRFLVDFDMTSCEFLGRIWTPEPTFTGVRWGDNDRRHAYVELEERFLPALNRNLLISNCSVRGHCWYSINQAGFKLAEQRAETGAIPEAPADLPARDEEARCEYYTRLHDALADLRTGTPENDREIGDYPMPVCPLPRLTRAELEEQWSKQGRKRA